MAIEEANKKGGYHGIPYKLMEHNDVGLWGAAANEVVKMDDEKVWTWLGTIDDIDSHVAIRATLEARNCQCQYRRSGSNLYRNQYSMGNTSYPR